MWVSLLRRLLVLGSVHATVGHRTLPHTNDNTTNRAKDIDARDLPTLLSGTKGHLTEFHQGCAQWLGSRHRPNLSLGNELGKVYYFVRGFRNTIGTPPYGEGKGEFSGSKDV